MLPLFYRIRNYIYLLCGHTLFNTSKDRKIVTVKLKNCKQVKSNPNRRTNYSLDDPGWKRVKDYPELFI